MQTRSASQAGRGGTRPWPALCLLTAALAPALAAQDPAATSPAPAPEPVPAAAAPASAGLPAYEARYHTPAEAEAFLEALRAGAPASSGALAERWTLGPLSALAFGGAGPTPLAERTCVFLVGGLDGVSLAGSEAVLSVSAELLRRAAELPSGVAFVAVPLAAPEALERTRTLGLQDGRDATPLDDDGDGRIDEDGPDDLDHDGRLLEMLLEDPEGGWARSREARLVAPARAWDAPRYARVAEGKDDDGDGRHNEDPPGGIVLDRSFPIGWEQSALGTHARALPLSSPVARALADAWLAQRTAAVLLFQGEHGALAAADAALDASAPLEASALEALAASFARTTGRARRAVQSLTELHGQPAPGAALEWIHAVVGALALEVAPWGPEVEASAAAKPVGVTDAGFEGARARAEEGGPPAPLAADQAWVRWLDNSRGGMGFVDWHPVELGPGRSALVGGFELFTRTTPPEKALPAAVQGLAAFVLEGARALPSLELRVEQAKRDGELCTLRVRLQNKGRLPTAISSTSRWAGALRAQEGGALRSQPAGANTARTQLRLELPPGARLLAGEAVVEVGELAGGAGSREVAWVVLAAPNSVFQIHASSPWSAELVKEVKP